MKLPIQIATVVSLFLSGTLPILAGSPEDKRQLREPPAEPKKDTVGAGYWGTVSDLTKTSITIQFDNQKDRKPKTFLVSETLAAGKIPMEPRMRSTPVGLQGYLVSPSQMYRLTDVKVGDWVGITYARVNGVDICDHIKIQKRPGGQVPPLPDEAEALLKPSDGPLLRRYIPYHEKMNAHWDLEDKGIPYPEKFGDNRQWPIAPPPREVKRRIPLNGP